MMSTWTMVRSSVSLPTFIITPFTRFLQTSEACEASSRATVTSSAIFALMSHRAPFSGSLNSQIRPVSRSYHTSFWMRNDIIPMTRQPETHRKCGFFRIQRGPAAESLLCGFKWRLIIVKCGFIPNVDWNDGLVLNLMIALTNLAADFCSLGLPQEHPQAFTYKNSPLCSESPPFSPLQDTFRSNVISASARRRSGKVLLKWCFSETCSALVGPHRKQPVKMCPAWKHTHMTMLGATMVANRLNMKMKENHSSFSPFRPSSASCVTWSRSPQTSWSGWAQYWSHAADPSSSSSLGYFPLPRH